METKKLVQTMEKALKQGCRFCSFLYRSKGDGGTAIFTVLLGVDMIHAYKRDLKILSTLHFSDYTMEIARAEIMRSLQDSIRNGLGHNANFTQKGVYQSLCKGLRLHKAENKIHLTGFIINKQVLVEGEKKVVKSSQKTICKRKLAKRMKCRKFRDFIFDPVNIAGLKINGKILEIQT